MLATLLLAAAAASPDAEALGLRLAQTGTLSTMLPLVAGKEVEDLIRAHPELDGGEQASLRETGRVVAGVAGARLTEQMGHAYARQLSLADLQALVTFNESPVAGRYRAAQPPVIAAAMAALGGFDFQAETRAAFCRKTGKLCDPAKAPG